MRRSHFLTITLCIVLVVALTILLGDEHASDGPVTVVNVGVESGATLVENGMQSTEVQGGERVTALPDGSLVQSSSPVGDPDSTEEEADTQPTPRPGIASLILEVKDTEGQILQDATATIRQREQYRIAHSDDSGRSTVDALEVGRVDIEVSHPALLVECVTDAVLSEGPNDVLLVVARRAVYSALLMNEHSEFVTQGIVAMSPLADAQDLKEADLTDRSPNDEGLFSYNPIVSGDYILSVTAPPYLPHRETVTARAEADLQTIVLSEKSHVSVAVQTEQGQPIGGARVTLQSANVSGTILIVNQTNDLSGVAGFDDVPPGAYRVSAQHRWYQDDGAGRTEVSVTHDHHNVTLTLADRAYTITGRVLDSESREPISGARVSAYLDRTPMRWDAATSDARSDRDGVYVLQGLAGGTYLLDPSHADYIRISHYTTSSLGTPSPKRVTLGEDPEVAGVDLLLYPTWVVSGRVLLSDGTPLEGARVLAACQFAPDDEQKDYSSTFSGKKDVVTGSDGVFRFVGSMHVFHERCKVRMFANHPTHQISPDIVVQPRPGKEITGVDLKYEEGATVSGRVSDANGSPLGGALVAFWDAQPNREIDRNKDVITQSDGTYSIALKPGAYGCRANKEGYRHLQRDEPLALEAGQTAEGIDFSLESGEEAFEGWASEEDGTPVPDYEIHLGYRGHGFMNGISMTTTDQAGRFRFAIEDENRIHHVDEFCVFSSTSEEYERSRISLHEWGASDIHVVLKRRDEGYANIGGSVRDRNGDPVTNYQLRLVPSSREIVRLWQRYDWRTIESPDGAFHFERLVVSAAPYVLVAKTDESTLAVSEAISLVKDEVRENIVIVLPRSFTVLGRIVDPQGHPLARAMVELKREIDGMPQRQYQDLFPRTLTDEHGGFRLDGIPSTGAELSVTKREELEWDMPFNPRPRSSLTMGRRYGPILSQVIIIVPVGQPGEERDLGTIVADAVAETGAGQ